MAFTQIARFRLLGGGHWDLRHNFKMKHEHLSSSCCPFSLGRGDNDLEEVTLPALPLSLDGDDACGTGSAECGLRSEGVARNMAYLATLAWNSFLTDHRFLASFAAEVLPALALSVTSFGLAKHSLATDSNAAKSALPRLEPCAWRISTLECRRGEVLLVVGESARANEESSLFLISSDIMAGSSGNECKCLRARGRSHIDIEGRISVYLWVDSFVLMLADHLASRLPGDKLLQPLFMNERCDLVRFWVSSVPVFNTMVCADDALMLTLGLCGDLSSDAVRCPCAFQAIAE